MTEALSRSLLSEPMTWKQICERYPDQWVVLVEIDRPDGDHSTGFRTARVAGAGKTRREAMDQWRPLRTAYSSFGCRYTGRTQAPLVRPLLPKPAFVIESLTSFWSPEAPGVERGAPAVEPVLSEPLTWNQIREQYPDQWVVLVEMEWLSDKGFELRTARVAGHGKTRGEPLEQARPLRFRYSSFCNFFTGTNEGSPVRLFL